MVYGGSSPPASTQTTEVITVCSGWNPLGQGIDIVAAEHNIAHKGSDVMLMEGCGFNHHSRDRIPIFPQIKIEV